MTEQELKEIERRCDFNDGCRWAEDCEDLSPDCRALIAEVRKRGTCRMCGDEVGDICPACLFG
jgi:hypothetical protein